MQSDSKSRKRREQVLPDELKTMWDRSEMQGHSKESYFPLRVEARGTQLNTSSYLEYGNTKAGNDGVRTIDNF